MAGEKLKILLVEDDPDIFEDTSLFLNEEGYKVLSVPGQDIIDNYEDAVAACAMEIPHIAVLDIDIRGKKDGIDIGKYIREIFYSPVIFLSRLNTDENIRRINAIGADGFVIKMGKPYGLQQLRTQIKLLIPRAELAIKTRDEFLFLSVKEFNGNFNDDKPYTQRKITLSELIIIRTAFANYILLEMANGKKYLCHKSLTDLQHLLPPFLLRFSQKEIINKNFIESKGKGEWVFYVNSERFEVKETYRTDNLVSLLNKFLP